MGNYKENGTKENEMILQETKFQTWRAVAVAEGGVEHLLTLGTSSDQVKKNYSVPFFDLLTRDEQASIKRILLEKWYGVADCGKWVKQDFLSLPKFFLQRQFVG